MSIESHLLNEMELADVEITELMRKQFESVVDPDKVRADSECFKQIDMAANPWWKPSKRSR